MSLPIELATHMEKITQRRHQRWPTTSPGSWYDIQLTRLAAALSDVDSYL